ncbi:conserved hypothetical protein [Frankia canadensis]|uniref:DUF1707 domain-containing protein n=1 Tax=Frankia canadensis TaxID=1836972 RepID=A0A2I2L2J5_9ACTN|nr:DUF1707 domain-containing protein [Frankia canadensis]SNQ52139.1 conserved hypothetical protein [Frankia canadensis]SOU59429.1 conserved hypothetical protein [Frankia canadensis]
MAAEIPTPPPDPALRVSDTEREEVALVLRRALAEGRLTFAEFDERVGAAYAARIHSDFAPLTADLPEQPTFADSATPIAPTTASAPGPPTDTSPTGSGITLGAAADVDAVGAAGAIGARPGAVVPAGRSGSPAAAGVEWTVAVLGGTERSGRWRPGRRSRAVAVLGGCQLDLRQIAFPTEPVEITAVAVLGGIEIIVPEGVDVEVSGVSVLGGRSVKVADAPHRPATPLVRVHAIAVLGGVDVHSEPAQPPTKIRKKL